MPPAVAEPRAGLGSDAEFHTGKAACKHLAVTALSPRSHGSANGCAEPRTAPPHPTALPGAPGTCRDHRGREQFGAEGILELIQCQPPVLLQDPELSVQERPPRAHHSDPAPLGAL